MTRVEANDDSIISRVLRGETNAFSELIVEYQNYVFAILSRHLPTERVTEVANDVFFQAYQSLASFRNKSPFKNWLATIAVRRCYDYWRKQRNDREITVSALSKEGKDWCEAVCAEQAREAFSEATRKQAAEDVLDWALQQLSAEDRLVVSLVHLDGLSVREAAKLLNWSTPNVKIRAFRARKQLRKVLENIVESEDSR